MSVVKNILASLAVLLTLNCTAEKIINEAIQKENESGQDQLQTEKDIIIVNGIPCQVEHSPICGAGGDGGGA